MKLARESESARRCAEHTGLFLREEPSIPSLEDIDSAKLPAAPDRYREPLEQTTALVTINESALSDPTGVLSRITGKALAKLENLIDEGAHGGDADYIRMKDYELRCVQTALNTQHKVDNTALKAKQVDTLPKLLEIMAREAKLLLSD